MANKVFSTERLFIDESVNIILNRIFTLLEEGYGSENVASTIGISGTVAKIIQGDIPIQEIKLMPFVTSNKDLLSFVTKKLTNEIRFDEIITFEDHVKIKYRNVNIEFWYLSTPLNLITSQNFVVQSTEAIPNYIL